MEFLHFVQRRLCVCQLQCGKDNGEFRQNNSIKQNGLASSMPKGGGKLNACEITQIEKWVNNGMPQ